MKKSPMCNLCGKVFSRRDNLERHQNNHQGEKMFFCDFCGKSFLRKSYLKLHHRIHSGERPFQCGVCGRTFTRDDHLLRHRRSHQGYKPYTCEVCGKALSRHDHLAVHRRIHTGERPFKCELCSCEFARSDHLLKHKRLNMCEQKPACVAVGTVIAQQQSTGAQHQDGTHVDNDGDNTTICKSNSDCLECKNIQHQQQQHQVSEVITSNAGAVIAAPTAVTVVANDLTAIIPNSAKLFSIPYSTTGGGIIGEGAGAMATQIYQTAAGVAGAINPITHIFPTIQISPATTQIFPTIQMYSAAQLNLQHFPNLSQKLNIPTTQIGQTK